LVGQLTGGFHFWHGFLPRDTTLARYMLSSCHSCVCLFITLSVCRSQVSVLYGKG